ncbi:MAG: hypothetical protein IJ675_01845, partial [Pseudobutyrivibrio sp.]|nr:hypothetical protein [Pseudobutyrivibrio sp.]
AAYSRNRLELILQRIVLFVATILLYLHNETEISLLICIFVNTIGVILFIVLDYEGVVVDENIRERKIAKSIKAEKKTLAPAIWLKNTFQLAGCAGLIINISMLSAHYLEQVI